jgi:hypothetical protein
MHVPERVCGFQWRDSKAPISKITPTQVRASRSYTGTFRRALLHDHRSSQDRFHTGNFHMTYRQLYFCCFTAVISIIGAGVLMAIALDIVSVPGPVEIVHYSAHHYHVADEDK